MIHNNLMPNVSYIIHAIKSYQQHKLSKQIRFCGFIHDRNQILSNNNFPTTKKGFGH